MRFFSSQLAAPLHPDRRAPAFIAVGLVALLAATWWPVVPVVTAMAILSLGATNTTLDRFRGTPALVPIMLLHGVTYFGLYGLFIGTRLHAAAATSIAGPGLWTALDLAASLLPMAIALLRIASGLRQSFEPER